MSEEITKAQPAVPVVSEDDLVACLISSGCVGTVKMSFESGPMSITRPSLNATKFARAIIALRPAVEPMTLPPVEGDVLPAIGSKVLIHLASSDLWVEHEVVGYYVWEAINELAKPRHHRVFVRVRDTDGILNARHICDVRGITAKAEGGA